MRVQSLGFVIELGHTYIKNQDSHEELTVKQKKENRI